MSAAAAAPIDLPTWRDELDDAVRGLCGGLLFGIPLLFTMEVWWMGTSSEPRHMAAILLVNYAIVVVLTKAAGFRRSPDTQWSTILMDSVEAVALGTVCVLGVLVLLQEITLATPLAEGLGKVVHEALPFSLGVAIARHVLGKGDGDGEEADDAKRHPVLVDLGASAVGAVFVGFNIAPTDEVPLLASAQTPGSLLALIAVSLVATYAIVYEADFGGQEQRRHHEGPFQHPLTETAASYLISLAAAAVMLTVVRTLGGDPWPWALSQVLVLGLPAAIGGAAGRVAV